MNPERLMTLPCTITHVVQDGTPDEYGDPTTTTTTSSGLCWIEQTRRDDNTGLTNQQTEQWAGYFPPSTVVDSTDQVTAEGAVYQIKGPPWRAFNPRTRRTTHIEATLVRVV